jgi:hypothetical protein
MRTPEGALDATGAARLLPEAFFGGRRVVMMHTDTLTDDEIATLHQQADKLKMTFYRMDVSAGANPRLYGFTGKGMAQPPTGTAFTLDDTRALLIPALPGHPSQPPNPLLITTNSVFPVEMGLRTTLAMNVLHPTAKKPRLPVTLHYGERIKRLLGAGVHPAEPEGALAWWL